MPHIFTQQGIYYLTVTYQSNRIRKSLKTCDVKVARDLAKEIEPKLLMELITGNSETKQTNLSLPTLIKYFLAHDHGWAANTHRIYKDSLNHYLKHGFPSNKSYRAMVTRCLNRCYKWGHMEGLIDKPKHSMVAMTLKLEQEYLMMMSLA